MKHSLKARADFIRSFGGLSDATEKVLDDYEAEAKRLREALEKIRDVKAEPVADGFVQGPAVLLQHAQSIARSALKEAGHG